MGKHFLIELLRGERTERVTAAGLDTLSTFGIMRDSSVCHIRYVLDCLIAQGYLTCRTEELPILQLNGRSGEIIKEHKPFMVKEAKRVRADAAHTPHTPQDARLFAALQETCRRLAVRAGVPAYAILSEAILMEICRRQPRSIRELTQIAGIPTYKAKRYGAAFVDCVLAYRRRQQK